MRLKTSQIPAVREEFLKAQRGRCAICRIKISDSGCLDHCHTTGVLRGVLCNNCNGIEGKVFNLARRAKRDGTPQWWIERLLAYWSEHTENPSGVFHPTHKTADEKRLLKNKRARKRRVVKKK